MRLLLFHKEREMTGMRKNGRLAEGKKRLLGEKKESKGMRNDMKMTLIKRRNDAIWKAKERQKSVSYI